MPHLYLILRTLVFCILVFFGMLYLKKHGLENVQQHLFMVSLFLLAVLSAGMPILFFVLLMHIHGGN